MELKELKIARENEWSTDKGPLVCVVTLRGQTQETALVVSEEISKKIVSLCAAEIQKAAKAVAEEMTSELLEATEAPKIEATP